MDFRVLQECGGFADAKDGSVQLRSITSQDLMLQIGSATGFRFARQFVESPGIWHSCPIPQNNLIVDFLSSLWSNERTFRGIVVKVGEVDTAKFVLIVKDEISNLFVSNEETRDYVFSLQDLGIDPLPHLKC